MVRTEYIHGYPGIKIDMNISTELRQPAIRCRIDFPNTAE